MRDLSDTTPREPMAYSTVTYQGQLDAYTFSITRDANDQWHGTCDLGERGGINVMADRWTDLLTEEIPSVISEWESSK